MTSDKTGQESLYDDIESILTERGIKSCTMDLVASRRGISKRTLYEIFENKEDMIKRTIDRMLSRHLEETEKIFRDADNVMEAITLNAFATQRFMQHYSAPFFRDLQRQPKWRREFERGNETARRRQRQVIALGIKQGVFRCDVNHDIALALVHLQHESLACMRDIYPPEVTMAQAFESITIGFLRSIASPKGMQILDKLTEGRLATSLEHETIEDPTI